MRSRKPVTLSEAARLLGRPRSLIRYLLKDRQIACEQVGASKVLSPSSFELLADAVAEYDAKPWPVRVPA